MPDGIGDNRISTRDRGIGGDRGNGNSDGDLSQELSQAARSIG